VRRFHTIVGVLGIIAFVTTGQVMVRHAPPVSHLDPELRLMYVSRHIYLLGASLVNLMTGLYLQAAPGRLRRALQLAGSVLLLLSPLLLALAFFVEPSLGLAGRSWRSSGALFALLAGALLHGIGRIQIRRSPAT